MNHPHNPSLSPKIKRRFLIRGGLIGLLLGILFTYFLMLILFPPPPPPPPPPGPCVINYSNLPSDPTKGALITFDSAKALNLKWQANIRSIYTLPGFPQALKLNEMGLQGGRFDKCYLQAIINTLSPEENYVPYQFGRDREGHLLISLFGGTFNPNGGQLSKRVVYKTGGAPDTWCPTMCP